MRKNVTFLRAVVGVTFALAVTGLAAHAQDGWDRVGSSTLERLARRYVSAVSWRSQLWAVPESSHVRYSSTGDAWLTAAISPWGDCLVVHDGLLWLFTGSDEGGAVYASEDGTAWPTVTHKPYENLRLFSAVSFAGKIWLLGGGYTSYEGEWGDGEKMALEGEDSQEALKQESWYYLDELWSYEPGVGWALVSTPPWPPRAVHSSVVYDNKMWVFGGATASGYLNDVWYSEDGVAWVEATGAAPWCGRFGHTTAVYGGKIWLMGGEYGNAFRNDIWCSEDGTNWTEVTDQAPWGRRRLHGCVAHEGKLWIIGGDDKHDVWNYEAFGEGEGQGEGRSEPVRYWHAADRNTDHTISLSELLRVIQFFNSDGYRCNPCATKDEYGVGLGETDCHPHDADNNPQDWQVNLSELLRVIQIFNFDGYRACPEEGSEDGFCLGMEQ